MRRWVLVAILMPSFTSACTRDPLTHADNVVVADEDARSSPPIDAAPVIASTPSAPVVDALPGPRPLTIEEVADRCGYKGSLICCLGPPIAGPPPKPYCYPAQ